ncbi:YifB family Mg chelatase-like AAA ATPase [Aminipila sp.]|uniref:YifB family Mg chelatase-like AAA ATPase n=1 Tax=Aminipila sp. TaxID=2060095 RepID=UPI00289B7845|nr:YifB family Mg chelatase-like AAA ATPase [Aminipila sp.]
MLSKVYTGALHGLESKLVSVETDLSPGLPSLIMVGLPDITVREAKERIRNAIINSGYKFPAKRITINLSPANTKKEGSHFDLPIAVGLLASIGIIPECHYIKEYAFMGELSLAGKINRIDGALPLIIGLKECGIKKIVLPKDNVAEASLVKDVELYPVDRLLELVEHFNQISQMKPYRGNCKMVYNKTNYGIDYADVAGQENVKRAVTICCAGGHGLLLIGPPGSGKSMISKRIPTVMPEMTYEECLEVTKIYSIGGRLSKELPMITERPFRAPHHTISGAALVGGGNRPMPGELSLAHLGVLFLDEFCEFNKNILEMLRQPLEDSHVTIARAGGNYSFPCQVMLVAASNPCPCGYLGSQSHECTCSQAQINHYKNKISGPLLDRIDLHVQVMPLEPEFFSSEHLNSVSSCEMREKVEVARKKQMERFKEHPILFNSQLTPALIKRYCKLNQESEKLMNSAFKALSLSARAYSKVIKISRTIADLENSETIQTIHVAEALRYRMLNGNTKGIGE